MRAFLQPASRDAWLPLRAGEHDSMPQIAVINESTTAANRQIQAMLQALTSQWNVDLKSIWGVDSATFTFLRNGQAPPGGAWWVVFLDDSDQADALAYHDLTNEGLPISKVFVRSILADNAILSVGASHEICEMAVDPWLNSAYQDSNGVFWAGEICDPVEDDGYGYEINGIRVTDFVTPDWFVHLHTAGPVDFKQHASTAFHVPTGGYAQKFEPQQGWVQVTGAAAAKSKRAVAARGTRRERRARRDGIKWKRSAARWGGEPP
jgi:hypothetical protein